MKSNNQSPRGSSASQNDKSGKQSQDRDVVGKKNPAKDTKATSPKKKSTDEDDDSEERGQDGYSGWGPSADENSDAGLNGSNGSAV